MPSPRLDNHEQAERFVESLLNGKDSNVSKEECVKIVMASYTVGVFEGRVGHKTEIARVLRHYEAAKKIGERDTVDQIWQQIVNKLS